MSRALHHTLGRVGLLLAGLCGSLVLGELGLRALGLPRADACSAVPEWAIPDSELGFRGEPGGRVAGFPLNELGLRGPAPETPKSPGRNRILFLGDSTVFGLGVELDDTFAARTTALLAESAPEATFDFVLGAFPGYSSYHSAILLERLLPLAPDLVVLYVGARNDETRARYFPDSEIPTRRTRLDARWHRLRTLRALEAASDGLYRRGLRALRADDARARVPPESFLANLHRIARRLEEAGVPALVVLPPISPTFEAELPLVRVYRNLLVDVARERALPSVSLDDRFAAAPEGLFLADQFHLSSTGHAIAAEEISAAVRLRALLDTRRGAP